MSINKLIESKDWVNIASTHIDKKKITETWILTHTHTHNPAMEPHLGKGTASCNAATQEEVAYLESPTQHPGHQHADASLWRAVPWPRQPQQCPTSVVQRGEVSRYGHHYLPHLTMREAKE